MNEVLLVQDAEAVRVVTMNRPDKRNALNTALTHGRETNKRMRAFRKP